MESRLERSKDMNKYSIRIIVLLFTCVLFSACTNMSQNYGIDKLSSHNSLNSKNKISKEGFLSSGRIVLSFPIDHSEHSHFLAENFINPAHSKSSFTSENENMSYSKATISDESSVSYYQNKSSEMNQLRYAPIIGFFPLTATFNPADNEVWLELDRESRQLKVYKGKKEIKTIKGEGIVALAPGEYPLQHKQKSPLWYAPDEYFENRELRVPPRGDNFRYRRGALGAYALYPTMDFIIHSGPFWSREVGGMKVSESELSSIFLMINVGTPIVVK